MIVLSKSIDVDDDGTDASVVLSVDAEGNDKGIIVILLVLLLVLERWMVILKEQFVFVMEV